MRPEKLQSSMSGRCSIAFVIPSLACGGAERQFVTLARHLKRGGWQPRFVVLSRKNLYEPFLRELQTAQVPFEVCQMYPGFRAIPTGVRLGLRLRRLRPTIVQGVLLYGNLVARLSRLIYWSPVNVSAARNVREGPLFQERFYTLTDPLSDLTVQNSAAGAARFVVRRYVPRDKIRVIPNGLDVERLRVDVAATQRLRQDLGLHGKFVWVSVGRLVPNKGFPCLIRAFGRVHAECTESVLLIVGEGGERGRIEKAIADNHLSGTVLMLGQRTDVPALLSVADACIMTSEWEGFPNVLLEAAGMGLPIVATDVGANACVVQDGITGFLVRPGDDRQVAERMLAIMRMSPTERFSISAAARERVMSEFAFERVVRQWLDLYEELLERKMGRRRSGRAR